MAIQVQLRRGTAAQNNAFTGAIGELSFDTTANQVRVHDGSTAGGFKIGVGDFPTGTNNVALGNTALDDLDGSSPGGSNTAVGHDALTANTTASNNVAIGKDALKANTTAASSTAVGHSALAANTGTLNTALGKDAGSLITSGTKNTILGSFDGNQGGLDIRTSNSHIVLSDGDGNPRLIIDNNGNVDIGGETTELKLKNTTHEDTDGGRESKITFQGEQSGGEQSVLAQIQAQHQDGSDDQKGELIFRTNDGSDGTSPTTAMVIDSAHNVGIGTAEIDVSTQAGGSGYRALQIESAEGGQLNFDHNDAGTGSTLGQINFQRAGEVVAEIEGVTDGATDNGRIAFRTQPNGGALTERMRLDHDGTFLVGRTTTSSANAGFKVEPEGDTYITAEGGDGRALYLNRLSSDGIILELAKDDTTVGNLISNSTNLAIGTGDTGLYFNAGSDAVHPWNISSNAARDDAIDLGRSSDRFDDIYATNSSIQTSDENEKQNIASLTSAEITAATAISKLFKTYKWKDKVASKGNDARTHTGVIAQQVQTAMSDAGLDASKYAFWCSNTWWEKEVEVAAVEANEEKLIKAQDAYTRTDTYYTKDEAPEGATERTRMGVRYPELLAFIGAATEQRLASVEDRLTTLEAQ
tara:strand:- start:1163 stop:3079 length:1917 start_codon:yes stop_codon:yes gene_type:complete